MNSNKVCTHNWVMYQPFQGEPFEICSHNDCGISKKDYIEWVYGPPCITHKPVKKPPTQKELTAAAESILKDIYDGKISTKKTEVKKEVVDTDEHSLFGVLPRSSLK